MNILGITCGHDAAACLIGDGHIVADAAEERFSRLKHDAGFPFQAIRYCLSQGGISSKELDVVVFAGLVPPLRTEQRFVLSNEQAAALSALRPVANRARQDRDQDRLPLYFERFELEPQCQIICIEHHLAHAAAAHFTRGSTERCLLMTLDGIGDGVSTAIWIGDGNKISPVRSWGHEASLGWFYGSVTEALGWQHGDGEGTTMGLAPYGDATKVADRLAQFHPAFVNGELAVPQRWGRLSSVHYRDSPHWHLPEAEAIREIAETVGREHVAARAQEIVEREVLSLARHWTRALGVPRLACGGGLFLNVKMNQRIWYEGGLEEQWVYPNPGDAGLAVGAALYVWHSQMQPVKPNKKLETLYHGPSFSNEEIRQILDARRLDYREVADPSLTAANLLAEGQIVAWFQGRMESGPRSLGNRSILMAADKHENKDIINSKVKFRESFRPFCPSILSEKRDEYLRQSREEPFMITSFDVRPEKLNKVPAVVHVDGTLRPQTVKRESNALYYDLIRHFGERTGEYLVLNTSLNIKGEPIACNPRDALRCFFDTGIDVLIMGNFVLFKPGRNLSRGI